MNARLTIPASTTEAIRSAVDAKGNGATLVFPAVNQAAADYLNAARRRGEDTICASSVASDDIAADWGGVHRLPSIHEKDFPRSFSCLVAAYSIRRIFSPVSTVHAFMERFIAAHKLGIELVGQSPVRQQVEQYRQQLARARRLLPLVELCADAGRPLSLLEVAGVQRQASLIYGESNDDKLAAMMGIFANAPAGDVVEIGSLMGRSAFVLLYLSRRYGIGPVLTIDPWMPEECVQRDSPDALQAVVDEWDYQTLSEAFFVNTIPFGTDCHAHLTLTSENAYKVYAKGGAISSLTSSAVPYSGGISVIHIDGNHDYDSVKMDCKLWLGRMLPESWLILDDYIWSHGDGPRRVGNELLDKQPDRVARAFVCGKALFVKLRF